MHIESSFEKGKNKFNSFLKNSIIFLSITLLTLGFASDSLALNENKGEELFIKHCAGCHINGGNIMRRNKTLKLKDLKRNGVDNSEAIAEIARNGKGIMTGYKLVLGEDGDVLVANWIWENSQKAWVQG